MRWLPFLLITIHASARLLESWGFQAQANHKSCAESRLRIHPNQRTLLAPILGSLRNGHELVTMGGVDGSRSGILKAAASILSTRPGRPGMFQRWLRSRNRPVQLPFSQHWPRSSQDEHERGRIARLITVARVSTTSVIVCVWRATLSRMDVLPWEGMEMPLVDRGLRGFKCHGCVVSIRDNLVAGKLITKVGFWRGRRQKWKFKVDRASTTANRIKSLLLVVIPYICPFRDMLFSQ
ncbi:hypothetical protein LZ32DRAFT_396768 [Colletotrichum eremochloae]|nr:hypothetical protein LZ32DRAFT_396768 [Colletotrichum eremochloae]